MVKFICIPDFRLIFAAALSSIFFAVAELLAGGKIQLLEYFNQPIDDTDLFVKFEKPLRMNDETAQKILIKTSHTKNITEFQQLPTEIRKNNLIKAHKNGVSIRQLNRLTGVTKGVIERILKEDRF